MQKEKAAILAELLTLSNHLGEPANEYVILGEGNTSARIDDQTFWVKASGRSLQTITADGFVEIRLPVMLPLLEGELPTDAEVTGTLKAALKDPGVQARPSIETILHAVLYQLTGAQFIGHTHAVAVNIVLCSQRAEEITRHLMPDVIVVCGAHAAFVPYTDPGVALARQVRSRVSRFLDQYGQAPRVIYLQNHGLFALGQTARQVESITAMAVKHARVLAGTYALGGPRFLNERDIDQIHTRPDEEVRRRQFQ